MNRCALLILAGFFLPGAAAVAAPACSILAQDPAAHDPPQVLLGDVAQELPAVIAVCRDVEIRRGKVTACARDAAERLHCRDYQAGQRVDAGQLGSAGSSGGLADGLIDFLRGRASRHSAASRGLESASAFMPSGVVLMLDDVFMLDFSVEALAGIERVELREGSVDGPLLGQLQGSGLQRFSTQGMVAGRRYWWKLVAADGAGSSSGNFRIADEAVRADVRSRIEQRDAADGATAALIAASTLESQSYRFDALQHLLRVNWLH